MEVKVLLYGILREKLGKEMISVELEGSPKAMDLFAVISRRYPEIAPYLSVTRLACGKRLLSGKDLLPSSQVALLPPVSGGSLTSSPSILRERLDLTLLLQETFDERAGAVVIFLGVVRGLEKGERVISIEYEGYEPLAERRLNPWARMVEDRPGISGPLAGILGGMEQATGSHLLVVGVDFPFLTTGFLRYLLKRSEEMEAYGVVPCLGGVWQPLVAVYPVSFQKTIEQWLKISGSVSPRQFLDDHRDRVVAVTERDVQDLPRLLWNLNTPEDYDALLSTPQGNLPP
jgi:molybdopterin synthase catalytic subunit